MFLQPESKELLKRKGYVSNIFLRTFFILETRCYKWDEYRESEVPIGRETERSTVAGLRCGLVALPRLENWFPRRAVLFTGRNGPDQHYRTGPTECVENNWIGTFVSLGQKGNEPRICCPRGRAKA